MRTKGVKLPILPIITVTGVLLLAVQSWRTQSIAAQGMPSGKSGDVLFVEPVTNKPYLLLHSDGGVQLLPGYTPEAVAKLLLQREKGCREDIARFQAQKPK